jgi:hypothetical protein
MTPSVIRANARQQKEEKFSPQQIRVSLRPRRAPEHLCVGKLKRFGQILAHTPTLNCIPARSKRFF